MVFCVQFDMHSYRLAWRGSYHLKFGSSQSSWNLQKKKRNGWSMPEVNRLRKDHCSEITFPITICIFTQTLGDIIHISKFNFFDADVDILSKGVKNLYEWKTIVSFTVYPKQHWNKAPFTESLRLVSHLKSYSTPACCRSNQFGRKNGRATNRVTLRS